MKPIVTADPAAQASTNYAAWVNHADQRAASILSTRLTNSATRSSS